MSNSQDLNKMVSRYRTLRARKDKIDRELDELKASIIDYLEDSGIHESEVCHVGKTEVKFVESSRKSLDRSAISKVFGSDLSQFERTTSFIRLYVK